MPLWRCTRIISRRRARAVRGSCRPAVRSQAMTPEVLSGWWTWPAARASVACGSPFGTTRDRRKSCSGRARTSTSCPRFWISLGSMAGPRMGSARRCCADRVRGWHTRTLMRCRPCGSCQCSASSRGTSSHLTLAGRPSRSTGEKLLATGSDSRSRMLCLPWLWRGMARWRECLMPTHSPQLPAVRMHRRSLASRLDATRTAASWWRRARAQAPRRH